ncbi:hypothetical protein HHK36_006562 [Tetracentron sinense]|uniref:ARC6 IMS domain-containing protein n=1 Tax=Tetracentron sinense TaxID=13715 RepID=A0A834ZHG1_TETSI|nr:hypothetical protein HHK36_006562 [Tetracentron sinense]
MALAHLTLGFPACCFCRSFFLEEQRNSGLGVVVSLSGTGNAISRVPIGLFPAEFRLRQRNVGGFGRLNVTKLQTVESTQIQTSVEIPVTCYQIVGVADQAEKDEIVKAVMDLKSAEIEEGYTLDAVVSRQDLLTDVRDKLLFEQEYAGNAKEKVPPKSTLRIPWAWLPGALCLLQEVGQENLVLEIGRAALQHPDAKPYIHDLLLSMALAECAIAKIRFEKNNVSQGFEALARAQYLLRSKISLGKMPLLSQIEESLEELAPACTLELLGMPHTPENAERRRGAIAALRELLRQGIDLETSCRVQDWPCFLSQALNKLMATEIVDLLPWDNLAVTRKNKKSLESQNQRVVIDFNCFYMTVIAHVALGFSSKQTDLINKAKTICECLVASEGMDLKFEEALCSFLLGQVFLLISFSFSSGIFYFSLLEYLLFWGSQGDEVEATERLQQLEINSSPASRNFAPTSSRKDAKDGSSSTPPLELWLKDAVLGVFPDTRDCSPSLVNFFGRENRTIRGSRHNKGSPQAMPSVSHRPPSFVLAPNNRASEEPLTHLNSTRHLGPAVKQLAPANLQSPLMAGKTSGGSSTSTPSVQLKRNLGSHHKKAWESLWATPGDVVERISFVMILGCFVFTAFKILGMQFGLMGSVSRWNSTKPKVGTTAIAWTTDPSLDHNSDPACIDGSNIGRLGKLLSMFKKPLKNPLDAGTMQSSGSTDGLSPFMTTLHKRPMPIEEAESLIEQWQAIKAEALGPSHHVHSLSEVLADSMLSQWQDLANSAKVRSCFWRFVLLQLCVLRADIVSDGRGGEMAEIEALLEEAAELVDESQPKNPNYYSTYRVRYVLKRREDDGSWRFCRSVIQTQT